MPNDGNGTPPAAAATRDDATLRARFEAVMALPRHHADPHRERGIDGLARLLAKAGCAPVHRHRFEAHDPWRDRPTTGTNLWCRTRPSAPRRFLLATHFDPPPAAHADPDPSRRDQPVPGANDGASGVVAILTILDGLRDTPDLGLDVVLFDGEELGTPDGVGYLAGSRALAADLDAVAPHLRRIDGGVVLDMVARLGTTIRRDPLSERAALPLVDHLFDTAMRFGTPCLRNEAGPAVLDDHAPLIEVGLPVVLLIDRDDPNWHTTADTMSAVSIASLACVADLVAEALKTAPSLRGRAQPM
ncbi:MAG: M28 family peptidase [Deltaproteobacteria bacterium]|nr:MAG: M28 family peptidase [Deltaproteobacteria bacterium]